MAYTTIDDPTKYFQVKKYTGNGTAIGSGGLAVTLDSDTNLQPDLVWSKNKDDATGHRWTDSARGVTKQFFCNNENGEATDSEGLTAFNSDGFTVGNDDGWNTSGEDVRAWCWKEDATAGFDMVTYTGNGSARTISHSLSAVPNWMVVKCRSEDSKPWAVYHSKNTSAPATDFLSLNNTNATADTSAYWNDTTPTSSVFTVGTTNDVNKDSQTYIAYLWRQKQGFSKFGKYIGNNNADGPFVYCGFKPAFVLLKNTGASQNWFIYDNKDFGINTVVDATNNRPLFANEPDTSASAGMYKFLFLSNGFKVIESGAQTNGSGNTFIYMAFAEAPFTNSNGVPSNAE
jgi:hypothetical protein